MKLSDLFVPRWQNSNPDVRTRAVMKTTDVKLLMQISEKDLDDQVRRAALKRIDDLKDLKGKP